MDFRLNAAQQARFEELKEYARTSLQPRSGEWDRQAHFPRDVYRELGSMGILGLTLEPRFRGSGGGSVDLGVAAEAIGYGDFAMATTAVVLPSTMAGLIHDFGSDEMRAEMLPAMAAGERLLAWGMTEPSGGSDVASLKTVAVKDGEGWRITGDKASIGWSTEADGIIIFAKTSPELGSRGVSAFLVPMDAPGVTREPYENFGLRAMRRGWVHLEDVRVPDSAMIGEPNRAFHMGMSRFDFTKVLMCLVCISQAQASLDDAMEYAKQRFAFGQPVARYEAISFQFAEHHTQLEAARLLCYRALWLRDEGLPHIIEAAMCKQWIPKMVTEMQNELMIAVGQSAYTDQFLIAQRMRDCAGFQIGDGTPQIQKIIIVRELLGPEFVPYER